MSFYRSPSASHSSFFNKKNGTVLPNNDMTTPTTSPLKSTVVTNDHGIAISNTFDLDEFSRPPKISQSRASSIFSNSTMSTEPDINELLTLPNDSTHMYSYNPLSRDALYLRLSILKRSLESLIFTTGSNESINDDANTPITPDMLKSKAKWEKNYEALRSHYSSPILRNPFRPTTLERSVSSIQTPLARNRYQKRRVSIGSYLPSHQELHNIFYNNPEATHSHEIINADKSDLINLLKLLNETLEGNQLQDAQNLHGISLFNINRLNLSKENAKSVNSSLNRALLDSLAEPFFEIGDRNGTSIAEPISNTSLDMINEATLKNEYPDILRPQGNYGRILRPFTSDKNSISKATFTSSAEYPWKFRAVNDLACLAFGISQNVIKAINLLDLIHRDSRNFVLNRLLSTEGQESVFSGEIVAIVQPNHPTNDIFWASFWAKRKNGMIICVLERVPCDYMDILLNIKDFSVDSVIGGEGLLWQDREIETPTIPYGFENNSHKKSDSKCKIVKFANQIHNVETMSISLATAIKDVVDGKVETPDDDLLPVPLRISNYINQIRYFTLNHSTSNIPCAISSSVLENEIKIKLHSLPYSAGLFIFDSHSFELLCCNKSICQNLFGYSDLDVEGKPLTMIIPNFIEIMDFISKRYPNYSINDRQNRSLVLSEHFFRKVQAEMHNDPEEFYTSVGINALHRDGTNIKIDFQIRVLSTNICVLWITHSREVIFTNYTSTASQLLMLNEEDIKTVSTNTSSAASSKSSSKRSTWKVPIETLKDMNNLTLGDKEVIVSSSSTSDVSGDESSPGQSLIIGTAKAVEHQTSINTIGDIDPKSQEQFAKVYVEDKSQFVNDENFKLDEDLINTLKLTPQKKKELGINSATTSPKPQDSDVVGVFKTEPQEVIGSQKRTKGISDFIILKKMGEGAYGKVALCYHKKEKYIVVIKMIFKERILVDTWIRDRKLGTIPSEIQIMATLNKTSNDSILTLLDFFEDDDYYYVELPVHGKTGCIDLFDLIEFKTNMDEFEAKLIFKQIVTGIVHLHENGIVHRDIKDENVIVDSKGFVKIIDFGSAAYVKDGPFDVFVGTIDYAAPEVLKGQSYEGKQQDIWALGILLYTIVFKENPFYNIDEILEADIKFPEGENISASCTDLISMILNRNLTERPTITEISSHPWLVI